MWRKAVREAWASSFLAKSSPMPRPSQPGALNAIANRETCPSGKWPGIKPKGFPAITATPFIPEPGKI
jgi:hypothetical protein